MTQTWIDSAASPVLASLAEPALRALALAAVTGVALALLRVRRTSLKLCVWTVVLAAAFAMPMLDRVVPVVPLRILPVAVSDGGQGLQTRSQQTVNTSALAVPDGGPGLQTRPQQTVNTSALALLDGGPGLQTRPQPWPIVLLVVYLLGAVALLARAVIGWTAARGLLRRSALVGEAAVLGQVSALASRAGLTRSPRLAESDACVVPLTMGVVRPVILLPADWREWPATTLEAVLMHELAHVARRDVLTQSLALVHRAVFWFSPLGWWLRRHLMQLAEYASDEAVLEGGVDRTTYAETLMGFFGALGGDGRRAEWSALSASSGHVAMAQGSGPERRVARIIEWNGRSHRLSTVVAVAVVIVALLAAGVVAAIQPARATIEWPKPAEQIEVMAVAPPSRGMAATEELRAKLLGTQPSYWRADRAWMFRQLVSRAEKFRDNIQIKIQIGTLAPLDAAGHDRALAELQRAEDANSSLRGGSDTSLNADIAIVNRFAEAIKALDKAEKRFDVGLSTVKEIDDALLAALAVLKAPSGDPESLQTTTVLVVVDVDVKDPNGATVSDLKPEEFRLLEDGVEQKITNVSLITGTVTPLDKAAGISRPAGPASYYLLNYYSSSPRVDADTSRFHKIEVRVSRPDATVRSRRGYFDAQGGGKNEQTASALDTSQSAASAPQSLAGTWTLTFANQPTAPLTLTLTVTNEAVTGVITSVMNGQTVRRELTGTASGGHLTFDLGDPVARYDASLGSNGVLTGTMSVLEGGIKHIVSWTAARAKQDDFTAGAHQANEPGATRPQVVSNPKPMYTPQALRTKIQGTVEVEAIVETDGTVSKARVIKSLDREYGLDDQAVAAAERWRFTPGTINGRPARFVVRFELTFTIR